MLVINSRFNDLLSKLHSMHEDGETPDHTFIQDNVDVFEQLWERGFSCYKITRFVAGNIKSRKMFPGVLTPHGIEAAKALT